MKRSRHQRARGDKMENAVNGHFANPASRHQLTLTIAPATLKCLLTPGPQLMRLCHLWRTGSCLVTDSKIVCSRRHRAPALHAARRVRRKDGGCKDCELFRLAPSASQQGNPLPRIVSAWQDVRRVAELTEPRPDSDKASSMRQFQRQRQHRPRPWQHSPLWRLHPWSRLCF